MKIVSLVPGDMAPVKSDFIRVDQLPSGAVALMGGLALDDGVVSLGAFQSIEDAIAAGTKWALQHRITTLVIELSPALR
ncbi:hypothetical protein [Sphingomonas sanxanigenens]|uniref:Uncharacterized protein n=1 Tax=Sphingomonas sanxanigenens DSM 19645 = NX02 TaxID=1123269 RepID=W0AF24_9SPHN|nr:hypothetical protein [Sphingomonas sanxanigenens]AHE56474.1 hypothetical protein NX02_24335 [Sphingomonas sanxanigenens DSM 19645 = NX02]